MTYRGSMHRVVFQKWFPNKIELYIRFIFRYEILDIKAYSHILMTNKCIVECITPDMSPEDEITKPSLTSFGHVMQGNPWEKALIQGRVSDKRKPSCQRTQGLDTIKGDTSQSIEQLVVQDWKMLRGSGP